MLADTLQNSCLEDPLIEKPGRPQSTGAQRVGHDQSGPVHKDARYFACGSSAPVRIEHEGGTAPWLAGTLVVPSVQGHGLPPLQELWPYQSFFKPLVAGDQRPLWPGFLHTSASSGTWRAPLPGVLLCHSGRQAHRGAPWLGSCSSDLCIRHLKGHPRWGPTLWFSKSGVWWGQCLYCSAAYAGLLGERLW